MNIWEQLINFIHSSRYLIIFLLCIPEGPVVMLSGGFLYRLGQFQLIPLYFCLVGGDFVADIFWYTLGRFAASPLIRRFGKLLNLTPQMLAAGEKLFKTHQNKILFISKITMGFGLALVTLITAGMLKVPFKKYAILNLLGGFVWTAFLMALGFFFGDIYSRIAGPLKIVFVIALLALVVFGLPAINRHLKQAALNQS